MRMVMNRLRAMGLKNRRKLDRNIERIRKNKEVAEDVGELAKKVVATINGDPNWFNMHRLNEEKENCDDGHCADTVRNHTC